MSERRKSDQSGEIQPLEINGRPELEVFPARLVFRKADDPGQAAVYEPDLDSYRPDDEYGWRYLRYVNPIAPADYAEVFRSELAGYRSERRIKGKIPAGFADIADGMDWERFVETLCRKTALPGETCTTIDHPN